jgi:hypothetical protein
MSDVNAWGAIAKRIAPIRRWRITLREDVDLQHSRRGQQTAPPSGFSGAVLLTSGSDRETLPLVTSGTALTAEAKGDVAKSASVSVTLKWLPASLARPGSRTEEIRLPIESGFMAAVR